jgi:predicted acetyltransferase
MVLVWPSTEHLQSYADALARGWSPDNVRGEAAAREELARIEEDREQFVAAMVDREARGGPITLPDATVVARLPGYRLWMWDGAMCGVIGLRWQPGTGALPPYCLGHIGYSVVPWKRRLGYATSALRQALPFARSEGLPYVDVTMDVDNIGSRRVVEACGGVLVEAFVKPAAFGARPALRFRIALD